MTVPVLRTRSRNDAPIRPERGCVLYWMTAARRADWSFALDRALEHCAALNKPLVVVEALRVDHRWACDRFHAFVAQGMADNARAFAAAGVTYHPYLEPRPGAAKGLLQALAEDACVVVTDEWPGLFLPAMSEAASKKLDVQLEDVDSNGVLPLRAPGEQVFVSAHSFRRFLQKNLPLHLMNRPRARPFDGEPRRALYALPATVLRRWPATTDLSGSSSSLSSFPIDHTVLPLAIAGGSEAAARQLRNFIDGKLDRFNVDRSSPDKNGQSGLSPWLHWGHLSSWTVVDEVLRRGGWSPDRAGVRVDGAREGWWGLSPAAEGFLDELITWREIGFNFLSRRADYDRFESLPGWAQETLLRHQVDQREYTYTLEQLASSQTHDPLWNAAQRQLVQEGIIQNYLRMLWGKKVLEWTPDPREALARLIELNNRYAIDGRDPSSYSGIFWVFGRYDRPWGPERPIFGLIRYMSSANTAKKHDVDAYRARFGEPTVKPARAAKKTATKQASLPLDIADR